MAVVLVSHGFRCSYLHPSKHERTAPDLSNSWFISKFKLLKCEALPSKFLLTALFMKTNAQQQEYDKININGSPRKIESAKELLKAKPSLTQKAGPVNGNPNVSTVVKDLKTVTNDGGLFIKNEMVNFDVSLRREVADDISYTKWHNALPSDEGFSWANESYNTWQRTIDIWSFVLSLHIRILFDNAKWTYINGFTGYKQKKRRQRTASWCREKVLQLGPTFIKLGQLSSTRSDLLTKEFVDELTKLQDRVPAFSPQKAKAFIERELGFPVSVLFKDFDDIPLAAASLGQVHQATLHSGENVVVKVQRPGLKGLFDIDLRNLKLIAEYFQQSETLGGPTKDWIGIYDECSKILYQEINYVNEGRNADRFRRDFRNVKWVRIPTVLWDYTSTKVLTMEYVPGIKINSLSQLDAVGNNRSLIASHAVEAYLIQILKTGFFHADPHPGNLAIDKDGSLIYYDFGMMGEIKPFTRERLLELFYSVYEKDAGKVMSNLIEVEALRPTGDMSSVKRSIQFFLDNLSNKLPSQQQTLAVIGEDLFAIATDQPFRFPSTFTFVLRAFSTIEGIGHTLDPEFSFAKVAEPYAKELLGIRQKQQTGVELVNEISKQVNDARDYTISMPYRIQKIEEFVKQLESGDLKLRVRVLESERAAWKATVLQMATIYIALGGTLINVGVTLNSQGNQNIANGAFIGAGILIVLLLESLQRVRRLDNFEKML